MPKFCPIFLDEFSNFVCPQFTTLISMARSAGFGLHFSHQSTGDLKGESEAFLNQVSDNSATKIILRILDPDTAEYMSRTFGTREALKFTHKVLSSDDEHERLEEGSMREVNEFRAPPDQMKRAPTGQGFVFIAHGEESAEGASHVLPVRFPRLAMPTQPLTQEKVA